ncbi:polymorphic toxin type 44 domain-containing protein [Pseudescherichia vulneris]|uniref:polymorphic toxin type 44 domain-containing protein n=1 Tax=Pseudescherichia vulneris TaxID=566 RepID=UPI003017FDA9
MRIPNYVTPYDISSFSPPGVDVISHMVIARFHGGATLMTYAWFFMMVRNHGPWDYKQANRKYANFGNFHYGAIGAAAGIPDGVLLRGAGAAQIVAGTSDPVEFAKYHSVDSYGDDPVDQTWIRAGIDYARRCGF